MDLFIVKRIQVDRGSSADVLYKHVFDQLKILENGLKPVKTPLIGFSGVVVYPRVAIMLLVIIGEASRQALVDVTFIMVDTSNPYNTILRRPGLNIFGVVASTKHLLIKFPTKCGIGQIIGDQTASQECQVAVVKLKGKKKPLSIGNIKFKDNIELESPEPMNDLVHVTADEEDKTKVFRIGSKLWDPKK
ncbi:hypothetical protein CFOL_v3_17861 [Cephalotus follicularis]|uniref:Uncharacterized protein n=1 Tax=Cephalotus follicularis TaxID=3775 RepID=A0A1Q3C2K1_CEPFO|nr:hypothetical protein CFOL_v3_17861 [Cephalotus follicularis]